MNADREFLLTLIDEAYDHKAPHGPNLRSSLRGLTANEAYWRPAPDRHNIWELVLHCAYWKFVAWKRITGATGVRFPRKGTNFFPTPSPSDENWRDDIAILDETHFRFRDAVANAPAKVLAGKSQTIRMVPMHDVYHAGQIRFMARLYTGE